MLEISDRDEFTLDVGGVVFKTSGSTVNSIRSSLLFRHINENLKSTGESKVVFFDRNAEMFGSVLNFYRTGKLHVPKNVCGEVFKEELAFWGIHENAVAECCVDALRESGEAVTRKKRIAAMFAKKLLLEEPPESASSWKKLQYKAYFGLENPFSSLTAKICSGVYLTFTIATIFYSIFGTTRMSRQRLPIPAENFTVNITNPKLLMFLTTKETLFMKILGMVCLAYFTIELSVRFIFYPRKVYFFKVLSNDIDLICVIASWVSVLGEIEYEENPYQIYNHIDYLPFTLVLGSVPVLRSVRLVSFANEWPLVKVLFLALGQSWRVLLLMSFIMAGGTLIYGQTMYLAEFNSETTFADMPVSCWWAIVTMTTVGYGDQFPVSLLGYLVGSVCALTGLVLTALPIAVIGHNFSTLYDFYNDNIAGQEKTRLVKVSPTKSEVS